MVTKVWKQDSMKFVHTGVELGFEITVIDDTSPYNIALGSMY